MIGTDEATADAERLAAPWPICPLCGEPHLPEHPCDAVEDRPISPLIGPYPRRSLRHGQARIGVA